MPGQNKRRVKKVKPGQLPEMFKSRLVRESGKLRRSCLTMKMIDLFCGPQNSRYKQIGNAVPVKLAEVIGEAVKEYL